MFRALVTGRVERREALLRDLAGAEARHRIEAVHFVIHRPGAVGHHVVLPGTRPELDAVEALAKQVDCRRTEKREALRIDQRFECRIAACEQHDQLDLVACDLREPRGQVAKLEEEQALRHRRGLLQQAVTGERAQRVRQQRLLGREAERPHAAGAAPLRRRMGIAAAARSGRGAAAARSGRGNAALPSGRGDAALPRVNQRADRGAEHELVQPECDFVGRADVEREPVDTELAEGLPAARPKADAQAAAHALGALQLRELRERQVGRIAEVLHACQLDRPQRHRVRGAELAVRVLPAR